jgi:hypothetical protein
MINEGDVPSVQCEKSLRWSVSTREVDDPRLILIYFNVPALAPRLNGIETALQLSENITLFAKCHRQRWPDKHLVFGGYHLYTYCTKLGTGRSIEAPMLVFL